MALEAFWSVFGAAVTRTAAQRREPNSIPPVHINYWQCAANVRMRAGHNPTTRSVALRCVPRVVLMHGVGGGGARARKPSTSPAQTVTSTSNAATGISQSSSHVSQNVAAFEQGPRKQTSTAAARNKGKPKATNDSETSDHLESLCTTLITRASAFAQLGAPKASGGGHFADARRNAGWSGAVARKSAHPRSEVENHGGETGARARRSLLTRARPKLKCFDLHLAAARSVVGAASLCVHSSFGLPEWLV